MSNIQTSKHYAVISALLAFLLWGGWSFYINDAGGYKTRVISGGTQGAYSFMITLLMTNFITFQYNKLSNTIFKILLPPFITVGVTGTMLVFIHIMVGTPSIFYTVSPALTVAFLFSFLTIYKLHFSIPTHKEK